MKAGKMKSAVLSVVFAVASAVGAAGCGDSGITMGEVTGADAAGDSQCDAAPDVSTPDISVPDVSTADVAPDVGADSATGTCAACAKNEKKIVLLTVNGKTNVAPVVEGTEIKLRLQEGGVEYAFAASMVNNQLVLTSKEDISVVLTDGTTLTGSAVVTIAKTTDATEHPTTVKIGSTIVTANIIEIARDAQDLKATTSAHVWMADTVANTFAELVVAEGKSIETDGFTGIAVIEKVTNNGVFVKLFSDTGGITTPERIYVGEGTSFEGHGLKFGVTASNNTVKPGCTDMVYTLSYKGEDRELRVDETTYFGDVKVKVVAAVFDEKISGNEKLVVSINDGTSKIMQVTGTGISVNGYDLRFKGGQQVSELPMLCGPTARLDKESARKFADFAGPRAKALARAMNDALKGKVAGKTC